MKKPIILFSALFLSALPSYATLPDQETYEFVMQRYSLPVEQTRDGCTYYANPTTLVVSQNSRTVSVLLVAGENSGTACRGVFKFKALDVDCQSNSISFIERIGSPTNWETRTYQDVDIANQICALPSE